jgi:hypothetical protein
MVNKPKNIKNYPNDYLYHIENLKRDMETITVNNINSESG